MIVKTPILDKEGQTVAQFVWDGTLYEGDGWFEQVDATPEQARAVSGVIVINQYLRQVDFFSIGERDYVSGWAGLEGNIGALRIALPAIGLAVGRFDPSDIKLEVIDNTHQEAENQADIIV